MGKKKEQQEAVKDAKFEPFEVKIAKNRFPKRKGNRAKSFAEKIVLNLTRLHDSETNLNISYSSVKAYQSILNKRIRQKRPISHITHMSFIKEVDSFDQEYENFCMRVYNYRETLRNFVSEFLSIKMDNYGVFLKDSKIRELGIDKDFEKFNKANLGQALKNRKNLTHRLTGEEKTGTKKLGAKISQQKEKSDGATQAVIEIMKIQDSICKKVNEGK